MGRWDTALLSTPSIEAMLLEARRNEERANVQMLQQEQVQAERQMLASLSHCPKCNCRLSAIDAKMGNCLACGSSLSAGSGTNNAQKAEGNAPVIVRI